MLQIYSSLLRWPQFLFLRVLPTAGATEAAAVFGAAFLDPIPLIVLITVFFAGAFFAGAAFLTIVVPVLEALSSLVSLTLPRPFLEGGAAGAALFPRPAPELAFDVPVALRV